MGSHTLSTTGNGVAADVAADLQWPVVRQEYAGIQNGARYVHTLITNPEGQTLWVVSKVESGYVKHMTEDMGPYGPGCSVEFMAEAERLCGPATGFAEAFRQRMRGQ